MALARRLKTDESGDVPEGVVALRRDGEDAPAQSDPAAPADRPGQATALAMCRRLEAELERGPSEDRVVQLRFERARLLEHPLGRRGDALDGYRATLGALPDHVPALRGARRCALRLGQLDDALELLQREAALAPNAGARAALLKLRARLIEDRGDDLAAATDAWRDVADLAPEDLSALRALERLARTSGDADATPPRSAPSARRPARLLRCGRRCSCATRASASTPATPRAPSRSTNARS